MQEVSSYFKKNQKEILEKLKAKGLAWLRILEDRSFQGPIAKFITDESNAANVIKRETPVMVVMGNPPYNEKSANTGEWITNLMNDYKQEPGQERILINRNKKTGKCTYKNTLKATNPKGINNDYSGLCRQFLPYQGFSSGSRAASVFDR